MVNYSKINSGDCVDKLALQKIVVFMENMHSTHSHSAYMYT